MDKPMGFENVEAAKITTKKPSPGAYALVIVGVREDFTKTTDERRLLFDFDIAEGEFKGYYSEYSKSFKANKYLKHSQLVDLPSAMPFFKRMIELIEKSNPGYKFNWNEMTLIGKKIGATLRIEEWLDHGILRKPVKIASFVSVEDALHGNLDVPAAKTIGTKAAPQNNSFEYESRAGDLPFD